jgi:DNA polymerase-3 subunit gamma/tau
MKTEKNYQVLARKWRPRQFGDVIGQEHVTRTLEHAIASHRVAHAYLFVGPRGIGKTTLSRLFAKALNCERGPTAKPCDECDLCREIMSGNSLDVLEIDAASNTGVDNIRDLRDAVQFAPARAHFKIFIIDEVHMLSISAFNALLKTLEEPPPHVKFIFATTEADKLPATIISRCQRFDLRRIPTAQIVEALQRIAGHEQVRADGDALLAIARGAEGGMRDALSALDQIISFKGAAVTEADVLAVFGLVSRAQLESLAAAILKGDMAAGLRLIDEFDRGGKDLRRLVVELLEHFRNLLVRQQLGADTAALDVTPDQLEALESQAGLADSARVLRVTELLADLEGRMRQALSRRTLLEIVLVRCCRATQAATLDQVVRQLTAWQAPPAASAAPLASAAGAPPAPAPSAPRTGLADRPVVKKALELFNGQIVAVEEGG